MDSDLAALRRVRLGDGRAPLLGAALDGLFDLLRSVDLDPRHALGARSSASLLERLATVGDWLDQTPLSLATVQEVAAQCGWHGLADVPAAGADWVDRWMTPELLLAVSQFPHAQRSHPGERGPWLQAVAALTAVDAYRPLLDASLTPEELDNSPGCHLRPNLGRLLPAARFMAATLGLDAVLAAATGAAPFDDALGMLQADEIEALLLGSHAPSAARAPQPFGEQDAAWLEDVLLAMLYRRSIAGGVPHALTWLPPGGGLRFDLVQAQLRTMAPVPVDHSICRRQSALFLPAPLHSPYRVRFRL
ncbi:MAG: hypothetical protein HY902_04865 [Deltaproteobacteria bacterium]|nr:hypothetical protein [Deltaproteobacteria bacterium]